MNIPLKTVVFEKTDVLDKYISTTNFQNLGFECVSIEKNYDELFGYHSQNKVDILVVCDKGMDRERLEYVLEIVYSNYCKNILIVTDNPYKNKPYYFLEGLDSSNFDLKLNLIMLDMKRSINQTPRYNQTLVKSKIIDVLHKYMFPSKLDGFKYYADALLKAYMAYPYEYSIMELYKEVGKTYNKSAFAVEKCMRLALLRAIEKVRNIPLTTENEKLRRTFDYTMTNNTAIAMFLTLLITDEDVGIAVESE